MAKASEQEVLDIIQEALNLKEKNLTKDSSMQDIEEWDSIGHLGLLSALDKFFGAKIAPIQEIATADSVQKILEILKKYSFID